MIIATTLFLVCHSFHLSVTDIFINKENKAEIVLTLFVDDLENAINLTKEHGEIDLLNEQTYDQQQAILEVYLADRCDLNSVQGRVSLNYLGHEVIENRCFIYMESTTIVQEEISFSNRLLMDVFNDQKNLIQFEHGQKRETALFDDDQDIFMVELD